MGHRQLPRGVAVDNTGNVVADTNHRIQKLPPPAPS
jgi:hypothetical protein